MRKKNLLIALLASTALIASPAMLIGQSTATQPAASQPASKQLKHQTVKAKRADAEAETAALLKEIKDSMEQQKAATQLLQQQLQQTQQQLQQTQQQLSQFQAASQGESSKAAAAETNDAAQAQKIQAELTQAEAALTATTAAVQKDEKKVADMEHPTSLAYKGIRISPGGFLEMSTYFRSHALLSDLASTFNTIPLAGQANTKLTARRRRRRQHQADGLLRDRLLRNRSQLQSEPEHELHSAHAPGMVARQVCRRMDDHRRTDVEPDHLEPQGNRVRA
jgi:hypothetical protein